MLSFKQFLLNELATPGTTPVPTGGASQSTWDDWNYNRRNQSAEDGSTVTPPTGTTPTKTPPTGTSTPTPQPPPPPPGFKPQDNPAAPGPNTGLSGLDRFEDPNADKRDKGGLEGQAGVDYARGNAQGNITNNSKFANALRGGLAAGGLMLPGAELASSMTGQLSNLGYSQEGLLDRINAFKDKGTDILSAVGIGAGGIAAGGAFGKTLKDLASGGSNQLATLVAAATYDPRAAGAGQLRTTDKEGRAATPQLFDLRKPLQGAPNP